MEVLKAKAKPYRGFTLMNGDFRRPIPGHPAPSAVGPWFTDDRDVGDRGDPLPLPFIPENKRLSGNIPGDTVASSAPFAVILGMGFPHRALVPISILPVFKERSSRFRLGGRVWPKYQEPMDSLLLAKNKFQSFFHFFALASCAKKYIRRHACQVS